MNVAPPPSPRGRPVAAARRVAFDATDPPDPRLLDACVHCGFCLPACPTYALWGEEMDSPRGRLWLMRMGVEGAAGLSPEAVRHLDSCLGCFACVPACPSGVAYDRLLAQTRQQVERRFRRPLAERWRRRLLLAILPHPRAIAAAMAPLRAARATGLLGPAVRSPLWARLPAAVRAPAELGAAADTERRTPGGTPHSGARPRPRRPAGGRPRLRVALVTGCVQRAMFGPTAARAARVLAAYGAEVWVPPDQGCCGALEAHAGHPGAADRRLRRLAAQLDAPGIDRVVVTAAGCGSHLKGCAAERQGVPRGDAERLRRLAGRTRDLTEVLAELGPPPGGLGPLPWRCAYHDPCHLAHAQGVREAPRAVLRAIPQLELVELPEGDLCCGSAGLYNLTDPEPARDLGARKAANVERVAPDVVVAANPGCQLQIAAALAARGLAIPVVQPADLVARALAARPASGPSAPAPLD